MELLKFSFAVQSTLDKVTDIGNASFEENLTVEDLVNNNPMFWLETDTNGNQHLCAVKCDNLAISGSFKDGNNVAYTRPGINFEILGFFGGHPKERPKAY